MSIQRASIDPEEIVKPEKFQGMSPCEPDILSTVLIDEDDPMSRQLLEVSYCEHPGQSQNTIVRFVNLAESPARPFERARASTLSQALESDVYTIGFPEMSPYLSGPEAKLTLRQIQGLTVRRNTTESDRNPRSSFIPVASACINALRLFISQNRLQQRFIDKPLVYDLYSLGNLTGIAAMQFLKPSIAIMGEIPGGPDPTNFTRVAFRWLTLGSVGFFHEYPKYNKILQNVPQDAEFSRFLTHASAIIAAGRGAAGSSIFRDLSTIARDHPFKPMETKFVLMPGDGLGGNAERMSAAIAKQILSLTNMPVGICTVKGGKHARTNALPLHAACVEQGIHFAKNSL